MLKKNWIYKRGDIYLADLGTPAGSVQGGVRPVINIQNNTGSFFGPTLIVIPLTTELKKLDGGDIKAVQGDSGHARAQMVTDQYSHILDDDRMHNADLFEQAFYGGKGAEAVHKAAETPAVAGQAEVKTGTEGIAPELLAKVLANPEMAALLTTLARNLK